MKTVALIVSLVLFLIVVIAIGRAIVERKFPFFRKFDESTKSAYMILTGCAAVLLAFSVLDLTIDSVDIIGIKASVQTLTQRVAAFSAQMETFFRGKKIESFDQRNWSRVRVISKTAGSFVLEVTLEQEPITGSVEVFEGPLAMPEQGYHLSGRALQFPANSDKPDNGITIKYFPRVIPPEHQN